MQPADTGYRMPAEWEPHAATWIGWPHNRTDWPGKIAPVRWVYGEMVRKIVAGERVHVLVQSPAREREARRVLSRCGADLDGVGFFPFPTNRGWTRDFGAFFVRNAEGEPAIAQCGFTGWAKYPDFREDAQFPRRAAEALGIPIFPVRVAGRPFVLEGGAIDVNGAGTVIATEECLLDPKVQARNPGLGRADVEAGLRAALGAANVIWLGRGIAGDDTHGHVDDLCRFVNPHTVVLCREGNPADSNHAALEENRERLQAARLEDGSRPEVVDLPMPAPLYFDGQRLPASYANFYFANAAVLVPTFNDPNDRIALGILSELITDRPVVGIHAVDLVWGLGTVHCLTCQQPARTAGAQVSTDGNPATQPPSHPATQPPRRMMKSEG
jgi:agmatine deiminase